MRITSHHEPVYRLINKPAFLLTLLLFITIGCQAAPQTAVTPTPDREPNCAWFNCGTLHTATQTEWQNASEENRIATAASFADLVFVELLGQQADFNALREQIEYRAFVEAVQRCINTNLAGPDTVEQIGPECAFSVPLIQ